MTIDRFEGEYEFLSNFSESLIIYERLFYSTVEHAYKAAKTLDFEKRELISKAKNPDVAKSMGRKLQLRNDWEEIKLNIMLTLVRKKFYYIKDLKKKLLDTSDNILIEGNYWKDTFWGVCDGKGENHLGKILMQVRKELLEIENKDNKPIIDIANQHTLDI